MKKYVSITIVVVLFLLMITGCSQKATENDTPDLSGNSQLELTIEELATYNGKDGNPAYIAVDGIIYDVSKSSRWKNGEHNGYSAGQDLTDVIKDMSPHGISVLSRIPVVGKIVE